MSQPHDVVDAIVDSVQSWLRANPPTILLFATFEAADGTDPDLSTISFADGTTVGGVRKFEHVGSMSPGDTVWCLGGSSTAPLIILGKPLGDISSYEA